MKCHFFTKYTWAGASSRYRSFQYLPALKEAGLSFTVSPLFDDAYLEHKYLNGNARVYDVLRAFARRLWAVFTLPSSDVVIVEYELLPWFPAVLERWLAWRGCRMIIDYDDALFHQYDEHPKPWVRLLLGRKIITVMRLAHTVIAGNAYLADYARRASVHRLEVIPTVIDLARYKVKEEESVSNIFTIGWIGSPSTSRYLRDIESALVTVCREGRARVRLVGSGSINLKGVQLDVVPWQGETEVDEIRSFDVGIMPLPDEPWARGKCGFKLIQYMACGIPVVATPVGVNSEIVEEGLNGLLVKTQSEWVAALELLMNNVELRKRLGAAGRRKVEDKYSLQVTETRFVELIKTVNGGVSS